MSDAHWKPEPGTDAWLMWQAQHLLGCWRSWAEHQNLTPDQFSEFLDQSDAIEERLLDRVLELQPTDSAGERQ